MHPPHPNSKRGKIYAAFLSGGVEAALRVGRDLMWSDGGIRSWCKKWQEEGATQPSVKLGAPVVSRPDRRSVHLVYDEDAVGIIDREGPEVSGVRFKNGTYRFVPNEHLVRVKSKPER